MHLNMDVKKIAEQTLPLLSQEYPTIVVRHLEDNQPILGNKAQHPLFYGCYDWHSAVHSHWQLLTIWKMLNTHEKETVVSPKIIQRLSESFENNDGIMTEAIYLQANPSFERPYGLAWLLYLCRELRQHPVAPFTHWADNLRPLESVAADNFLNWLPKLSFPIRGGLHNQTAFSLSLIWDWAITVQHTEMLDLIRQKAFAWHANEKDAPVMIEPSSADFLSPTLCTIELMKRVLEPRPFLNWLDAYLPPLDSSEAMRWLTPVEVIDEKDGRLAHFAGLNLSRAAMLLNLYHRLPTHDKRRKIIAEAVTKHLSESERFILSKEYMLTHWVPTFAILFYEANTSD